MLSFPYDEMKRNGLFVTRLFESFIFKYGKVIIQVVTVVNDKEIFIYFCLFQGQNCVILKSHLLYMKYEKMERIFFNS